MFHLTTINAVSPKIRRHICDHCWRRSPGSESLSPAVPRECQEGCPVFELLPTLVKRAQLFDPMLTPLRRAVGHVIDQYCEAGGDTTGALKEHRDELARIVAREVERRG